MRAAVFWKLRKTRKEFEKGVRIWDACQVKPDQVLTASLPLPYRTSDGVTIPERDILRQVYDSERYIEHCIGSRSPYSQGETKPLSIFTILCSNFIIKRERASDDERISAPEHSTTPEISWSQCQRHIWKAIFTFRFPRHALVIYSHLQKSKQMDPINGPFQIYAAMAYESTIPQWSSISLASSLLLTRPESSKKRWLFWYYALCDLTIHVVIILQLELTLLWNNVSGLTSLWTSVGQLIPFIVGIGGLCLVSSRLVVKLWKRSIVNHGDEIEPKKDWTEERIEETEMFGLEFDIREAYARWREMFENSSNNNEGNEEAGLT